MKNKILVSIIIILLPVTITMITKKDINHQEENLLETNDKIYIHFLMDNETKLVPLEEYLINVVGAEVPALFNIEALKAQAIASRTFALFEENTRGYVTTGDQAYNTLEELHDKWQDNYNIYLSKIKSAVNMTANLVMTYDGSLIKSYFYAMSNGFTTTSLSVFKEELPYLNNTLPTMDNTNMNKFEVTKRITKQNFCAVLNIDCLDIELTNIIIDESNRVTSLSINNKTYKGTTIRQKFNLRSTDFTIKLVNNDVVFTTRGYGHGVGMSQYGANEMAKIGSNYEEILKYYYQDIKIESYN